MQDQAGRVRHYYNRNTPWMLLLGQGRGEAVIHRPVWLKQGVSRREALHTVDRLIADALVIQNSKNQTSGQILDLGCGVGGSAVWLAKHYPVNVTGITVSPIQAQFAQQLAVRRGLSHRCRFLIADFTRLPAIHGITGAYAIESFSHGGDPETFFFQIGNLLPSGSRLILCDDFLSADQSSPSTHRETWLARFREGWHLQSLMLADHVVRIAGQAAFQLVRKQNLTFYLRQTPRFPFWLQRHLGTALRGTAWGSSMHGGSALQVCQENGWTEYLFLVLEKR